MKDKPGTATDTCAVRQTKIRTKHSKRAKDDKSFCRPVRIIAL
jgi:hypothetical protein